MNSVESLISKLFCFLFAVSTCIGDFVRVGKVFQFFVESRERYLALHSFLYHFKIANFINLYHIYSHFFIVASIAEYFLSMFL